MLVLSRNVGRFISIGDTISVRILAVHGDTVRIGVEAPQHINVYRCEVYARLQARRARLLHSRG
ncbi:carbon storage regulator, CsrA [Pseudomonas sp. ok272]|uniref:carbon storage regulator CsrA n=1 Tax=unclassified Pseudomonas TaxID=196821 RepID=UPI0008C5E0C3|nr:MULTISPECIES: carbon storage regulator CsrA [unclassified Pseudomonas]SEN05052.1 carbon storage regulator, CsrA [Pseudomonas sp. ok272]SFN01082.1 carbon storage regulator, CsrA [Pseudomonas sp. ok602]